MSQERYLFGIPIPRSDLSWSQSGVPSLTQHVSTGFFHTLELKARMMRDAEELIDKLLWKKKPAHEITLSDIEQAAVETGMSFQQAVVKHLVEDSQGETSDIPICLGCGEKMELKGHRKRRVETEAGEIELKRPWMKGGD